MFRILDVSSLVLISIPANIDGSETYQVLSNINIHFSLANTIFGVISRDSTSVADCQDFFFNVVTFFITFDFGYQVVFNTATPITRITSK